MEQDIKQILDRLNKLEEENKSLKESLSSKSGIGFAPGVHLRNEDPNTAGVTDARFARRVIIETSPGAAEAYSQETGNDKIVDTGGLVKNSKSNPIAG